MPEPRKRLPEVLQMNLLNEFKSFFGRQTEQNQQFQNNVVSALEKIDVKSPDIKVETPKIDIPTPVVNYTPPELNISVPEVVIPPIKVPTPQVTVNVPEIKLPKFNIPKPDPVDVNVSFPDTMKLDGVTKMLPVDINGNPMSLGSSGGSSGGPQLTKIMKQTNEGREFSLEVAKGNIPKHSFVHKFGRNANVGTSIVPVCSGGNYQTPTSAQSLEFLSTSSSDALNSTGMHEITMVGLDSEGYEQIVRTSAHATNGTTPVAVAGTWLRLYRAYVSKSGVYASQIKSSHVGTVTIRGASGGTTWAEIPLIEGTFGSGQSLIGAYTIPKGKSAYILSFLFSSDVSGTKTTNFYFFERENILDTSSSFEGTLRVQNIYVGTQGVEKFEHQTQEKYNELTDIGFLALGSAATEASVEFEMLLVDD